MFEIHIIPPSEVGRIYFNLLTILIYTERETDVWNPYYPHQVRLVGFTSTYLTIQYIQRERLCLKSILSPPSEVGGFTSTYWQSHIYRERDTMFEIHIIPTKWGWPDLLQHSDNPIYTERETMFEIHIIPTKWGWPDLLQHIDNPIYTERETRCLKSILSPPSEVGRIYFNLLTIQYIQRERRCLKSIIPPSEVSQIYFNILTIQYIQRERHDVWNP